MLKVRPPGRSSTFGSPCLLEYVSDYAAQGPTMLLSYLQCIDKALNEVMRSNETLPGIALAL